MEIGSFIELDLRNTGEYYSDFDAVIYSIKSGKIYACDTKGTALSGFPLAASEYFTAADFSKNGKMSVVTTSTTGTITMYRIPKNK